MKQKKGLNLELGRGNSLENWNTCCGSDSISHHLAEQYPQWVRRTPPLLGSRSMLPAFPQLLPSFRESKGQEGGRLYIRTWCILKLKESKFRVGKSTMWEKKKYILSHFYVDQHRMERMEVLWWSVMKEGERLLLGRWGGGCLPGE